MSPNSPEENELSDPSLSLSQLGSKMIIDEVSFQFGQNEQQEEQTKTVIESVEVDDSDRPFGRDGFGIQYTLFESQTSSLEVHTPEEAIVRGMLVDYFSDLMSGIEGEREVDPNRLIFSIENDINAFNLGENLSLLIQSLYSKLGWSQCNATEAFVSEWPLNYNFPEVCCIRIFHFLMSHVYS
jgi:hypothetical protein